VSLKIIRVRVGDNFPIIQIGIDVPTTTSINQTVKTKLAANKSLPFKRLRGIDEDPYDYFKLYTREQVEVKDAATLIDHELYFFKDEATLDAKCGSQWTFKQLTELKVRFTIVNETELFPHHTVAVSAKATKMIEELQGLNYGSFNMYHSLLTGTLRDSSSAEYLQDSIYKAVYMAQKYSDHESGVDCFVLLLLNRLGFFDDWLYVFPQLHLKLVYGDAIVKEAIPDFTVMDVESVLRMAVVKDKRRDGELEDSEPQLIAALIALFQADVGQKGSVKREARELHSIVGLRQVLVLPHR